MTDTVQKIRQTTTNDGAMTERTTEVKDPHYADEHASAIAYRAVWLVAGILLTILALRFVLSLLGANSANNFANFIYTISHPFVAPFFSLFKYNSLNNGVSHFELYTLVAMLVYALVATGLGKLVTINRD